MFVTAPILTLVPADVQGLEFGVLTCNWDFPFPVLEWVWVKDGVHLVGIDQPSVAGIFPDEDPKPYQVK